MNFQNLHPTTSLGPSLRVPFPDSFWYFLFFGAYSEIPMFQLAPIASCPSEKSLVPSSATSCDLAPCAENLNSLLQFEQSQLTLILLAHPMLQPIDCFGSLVLDFLLKVHFLT